MCIEQHGDYAAPIKALLADKGYKQVFEEASGHDGFYVPRESEFG